MKRRKLIARGGLFAAIVAAGVIVVGCSRETYEPDRSDYSEYLYLSAGFTDPADASPEDSEALKKAFLRVGISNEDGFWKMKAGSAKEINVSNEIYLFFQEIVDSSNERDAGRDISYSIPLTKTRSESDQNKDSKIPTDCVAHCVANVSVPILDGIQQNEITYRKAFNVCLTSFRTSRKTGLKARKWRMRWGIL